MEDSERQQLMVDDLTTSEIDTQVAQHRVTQRALIYTESGLPLPTVLEALKVSRATWYRRVAALDAWKEETQQLVDLEDGST